MEKLTRFSLYLAIGITITIFALILFSVLPNLIENSSKDWKSAMNSFITDNELKEMLSAQSAYVVFKEKYPNASENYERWNDEDGRLELIMINYTNFNEIRLQINYDNYLQNVRINVDCTMDINDTPRTMYRKIQGNGVVEFIEKADCLNFTLESDFKEVG